MKKSTIWVRTAFESGRGSYYTVITDEHGINIEHEFFMIYSGTTQNRPEIYGVLDAMKLIPDNEEVIIYSSSQYVVRGVNEWLDNWIKKDFEGKENVDLWKEIVIQKSRIKTTFIWIKSDTKEEWIQYASKKAKEVLKSSPNKVLDVIYDKRIDIIIEPENGLELEIDDSGMDDDTTEFNLSLEIGSMRNDVKDMIFKLSQMELKLDVLKTKMKYPSNIKNGELNYPKDVPWNE